MTKATKKTRNADLAARVRRQMREDVAKPARLDADRTAKPKTELRAAVVSGQEGTQFAGPATHHVDRETGNRTALGREDAAYYAGLERRLAEEERTNPAVRRAAEKLEKVKTEILAKPRPPREVWVSALCRNNGPPWSAFGSKREQCPDVRYVLAEPPREPTAAELDALAITLREESCQVRHKPRA